MTPEGRYIADLVSGTLSESSNGNPQVVLQLKVDQFVDPVNGLQGIATIDRRAYLSYAGGAIEYTEKKLRALKFGGNFEAMQFGVDRIEVLCAHEPKQDGSGTREKWDVANWGDSQEVKPASKATIMKMNQLWKARQNGNGGTAKPAATTTQPTSTRPAPRQNAKPAGPTATADDAWRALCETHANKSDDWKQEQWQATLAAAQQKLGKPESDFTGADWHSIKETCQLPF